MVLLMSFTTSSSNAIFNAGSAPQSTSTVHDLQGVHTLISFVSSPSQLLSESPQLVAQKTAIKKHPLFPLLTALFEKCEQGTTDPSNVITTEAFNAEMENYIQKTKCNELSIVTGNPDLDSMMIKAVQVLRIHLLELEKVQELCLDFCTRYIACIKAKLNSHGLLKIDDSESDDESDFSSVPSAALALDERSDSNDLLYQMVHTDQGIVAKPIHVPKQVGKSEQAVIEGTTPLSLIGSSAIQMDSNLGPISSKITSKRGILPKQATQIMKSWLFQHIVHPYPTEEEKQQIAQRTNLSLLQVNNWFINARRRILQPMLDSGNDPLKARKSGKAHSKQVQRFWPIADLSRDKTSHDLGCTSKQNISSQNCTSDPINTTTKSVITADGQIINPVSNNLETYGSCVMSAISPMLSQATGQSSPTFLQTNSSHQTTANSDSGGMSDTQSDVDEDLNNQVCLNSSNSDLLTNQNTDLDSV